VAVIEDCAHAFFGNAEMLVGQGDYVVASLTKFFPTYDGGILAAGNQCSISIKSLSFKQELKVAYNTFHDAVRYGRFKSIAWMFSLISRVRSSDDCDQDSEVTAIEVDAAALNSDYLDGVDSSASKTCQYIVSHTNFQEIIDKRKENYRYILSQLSGLKNIDLSLNCRDEDFIPYMVIIRLHNPATQHASLIKSGLAIWRWEDIYPSDCQVAKEYSQSIIQVPCHQQLTDKELMSIVVRIKACLEES
jgi:dTDP-4-amino-4,6-dideoxygalactose transaminase